MVAPAVRVPRLIAGVDLTKLPLSPLEGFVLSRIDGMASIAVLADLTNLAHEDVAAILERLIELGAVEWARESVSLPRATGRTATRTPSTPFTVPESLRGPAARVNAPRPIRPPSAPSRESPHQAEGVYRDKPSAEERVDPARRSVFPPGPPRASHTGTRRPPGELEEVEAMGTADTVPPPPPEPLGFEEPASEPPRQRSAPPPGMRPPTTPPEAAPTSARRSSAPPAPSSVPLEAPAEQLDLDAERRKRIDDLYVALDLLDHYQTLGVDRDASRDDIRAAYFKLSKVFHPDTMFRKRLGPYKAKMEAIFKRLTEAYEVLGKKRPRQEYDRYLGLQDRTREIEGTIDQEAPLDAQRELGLVAAQLEAELAAGDAARASAAPSAAATEAPSTPQPAPRREPSEAARARARELMAKKLRSAARASEANRSRNVRVDEKLPSEPPAAAPADKGQILRSLTGSLKDIAGQTGGLDQAQRHFLNARRAEREGDLAEASRSLRLAMALAPEREDLRGEHARVNGLLASSLSGSYEEQALYETRHGKWGAAALSWAKVFEGRPTDARAARNAAEALVEAKGDLHRAAELAQKATELEPDDIVNLRALARVYIAAGLALNARRVLQRAAALDPNDEMVENLLRELKR